MMNVLFRERDQISGDVKAAVRGLWRGLCVPVRGHAQGHRGQQEDQLPATLTGILIFHF